MKKRFVIIFILMLTVICFILYLIMNKQDEGYAVEQELYSGNATMIIKEGTLTKAGTTVIIKNESESPIGYGEWYRIDKQVNGEWIGIKSKNEDYVFNAIGYELEGNKESEEKIDWTDLYGKLKKGKYRLVKDIGNEYVAVEFDIE